MNLSNRVDKKSPRHLCSYRLRLMSLVSCTKNILGTTGRPQYWPRQTTAYAAFIPGYMLSRYKLYPLSSSVSCISDKIIVDAVLSPVSTTRVHGPSWRPVNSGAFLTLELTARVDGCQKCTRVHGPSTRVHFLTPVNSGSGNRALRRHVSTCVRIQVARLGY